MKLDFSILDQGLKWITNGVETFFGKEFCVSKKDVNRLDVEILVNYLIENYYHKSDLISDGETLSCGSWLLKFVYNENLIEIFELKEVIDGKNTYEFDVSVTISLLKEQMELLNIHKVDKSKISFIYQKVAISKEIYDGSEVNGVRYQAPDHMTGWYLTSNNYNGDVKSLFVDHLYHLLKIRPELGKFLALPPGYRFFIDDLGYDIWLDESVVG